MLLLRKSPWAITDEVSLKLTQVDMMTTQVDQMPTPSGAGQLWFHRPVVIGSHFHGIPMHDLPSGKPFHKELLVILDWENKHNLDWAIFNSEVLVITRR